MRRFAELDENNIVIRVIVVDGEGWLDENLGGVWVESFTDGTRVRRASIGYSYDSDLDAFIPPKPFDSWVFSEELCAWVAPVAYPDAEKDYVWDEDAGDWVAVPEVPEA